MKLTRRGVGGGASACGLVDEEAVVAAAVLMDLVAEAVAGLKRAIRPVLAETPKSKRGDLNNELMSLLEVLRLLLLRILF